MRFLSIGECMVELAPGGAAQEYAQGFAGDTFNTIWYLRRLRPDVGCAYMTCVGTDPMSDRFMSMVAAENIDDAPIYRRMDRTMGLYMIAIDNGERSFSYWRDQSAARLLAENRQRLRSAMTSADLIYFSGITLAILPERSRSRLLECCAEARLGGATIAFDPNLRPALWDRPEDMRRWITKAAAVSDILLPSFEDEMVHFGDPTPADTLERYAAGGAETVIVKNAGDPVLYRWKGQEGTVTPPAPSSVVDTTAAGDSFNAGLFAMLDTQASPADCIFAAAQVASRVIAGRGALVNIPNEDLINPPYPTTAAE